ncbi:UNVERIFIED_ORG: NCS1 family nucleobase:cation symporter-1 [Peribacillus simplex]
MSENTSISKDVAFGFLPARKNDRVLGFWSLLLVQLGTGLSCFSLLTGGYTGIMLDAKDSIGAIFFGNAIPIFLFMPIAIYFARYGIDTFVGFRSSLGYSGANVFYGLFAITTIGYATFCMYMSGQAMVEILNLFNVNNIFTVSSFGVPFFSVLLILFCLFVTSKGPIVIKYFNWVGAPAMLILILVLLGVVLFGQGLDKVFGLQPAEPYDTARRSFATAIELNVGLAFSWLPYIGQYSRLSKNEKGAFNGGFFAYGIGLCIAAILAVFMALVTGSLNPTDWMTQIGGTLLGVVGLALLILGNVTAAIFYMYSQAISFKTIFPKQKWGGALAANIPIIFLVITPAFYNSYNIFILLISFSMSVFSGIIVTDFFFVKKQNISVRDLYNTNGIYKYWYGFNPSAILSVMLGTIVYWLLYNPLLNHPSELFYYTTAGIPTFFVTGICYYVVSKYIFIYKANNLNKSEITKSAG